MKEAKGRIPEEETKGAKGRDGSDPSLSNVVAYVRVSTEEQRIGPHAQAESIQAYASRNSLSVVATYLDRGVSGATPIVERPALQAALDHARDLRCSLIVAKRDRIARDVLIAAMVDRSLPKGAGVVSADGSGNGSNPADALMRTILDGMAEYERALIRARTKAALQSKRSRGERAGNVPFGYTSDASGRLSPDPEEQETIRVIRELVSQGIGQRAIVRALQALGRVSRSGTPLGLSQVQRILRAS